MWLLGALRRFSYVWLLTYAPAYCSDDLAIVDTLSHKGMLHEYFCRELGIQRD